MNELANQVAVVTGAGRGIGQAIALKLAGAGADVACVDLKLEFCAETVQKTQALGSRQTTWNRSPPMWKLLSSRSLLPRAKWRSW